MQGQCWQYDLASTSQSHHNYLENTKRFETTENCPEGSKCRYGTVYSSLGMSLHSEGDSLLLGAPGTYTWEGTLAALR